MATDGKLPFLACLVRGVSDGVLDDIDIGFAELLNLLEGHIDARRVIPVGQRGAFSKAEVYGCLRGCHQRMSDVEMLELEDILEGTGIMARVV